MEENKGFSDSHIMMLRHHVDKHLFNLARKIEICADWEKKLGDLDAILIENEGRFRISPPGDRELWKTELIRDRYRRVRNDRDNIMREIDNLMSIVGSNISLLIEHCMQNYSVSLKVWIKRSIVKLVDLREMLENASGRVVFFPMVTAQLSPYVFKTRVTSDAPRFAVIRNAIRDLINS